MALAQPDSRTLQEAQPAGRSCTERCLPYQDPRQLEHMLKKDVAKCVLSFSKLEMVP